MSQWGQDFRPSIPRHRGLCELAARASARGGAHGDGTARVQADVRSLLALSDPVVEVSGFDRPNLSLASFELTPKQRERWTCHYVLHHPNDTGIVYATTRKKVDQVAGQLRDAGVRAAAYHAGMSDDARTAAQEAFVNDDVQVMVATNAFGMGIDKSNVRYVINCGLPQSLEEYYQEAGRAGRDGEPAECYLLWSRGDIRTCHFFIDNIEFAEDVAWEDREQRLLRERRERLLGEMIGYAMSTSCLRRRVLRYFGQREEEPGGGLRGLLGLHGRDGGSLPAGGASPRNGWGPRGGTSRGEADETSARRDQPVAQAVEDVWVHDAPDEELFQRLRVLRKSLADEAHVPPYVVFSDRTLRAMVRRRPRTEEELLEVPGVGQNKLERYGEAFLEELWR